MDTGKRDDFPQMLGLLSLEPASTLLPVLLSAGRDEVNQQFVSVYFNGGNKSEQTLRFEPRLECESGARWFHQNNLICLIFERVLYDQLCFRCLVPFFFHLFFCL